MQKSVQRIMRALPIILVIFAFLIFSGCVNLEVRQKIGPDGTTNGSITARVDMNALYTAENISLNDYSTIDSQVQANACNESVFAQQGLTNISCEVSNAVYTFSADTPTIVLNSTTFSVHHFDDLLYTEYWYTPPNITQGVINITTDDMQMIRSMKSLGANATMVIEMPGEVYETNGNIVNGAATFDLFDMITNGTTPYVKSRELNLTIVSILAIVLIAFIVTVWTNIKSTRDREKSVVNPQLVDWLRDNLAKGYDLESLKSSMLEWGHSKNDIEAAVKAAKAKSRP